MDSDIISRILKEAEARDVEFTNELSSFLDDGISSILAERREPYYTIAKNKIKHLCTFEDQQIKRSSYKDDMISRLNGLYFRLQDSNKFSKAFIEICLEIVKGGEYLNKNALTMLNDINKLSS
jgi:hypothetical protein